METIKTIYKGELRTSSLHLQSGKIIITDAPTDNLGKGEAFSPTDLLTTALATCMITIMGIQARKNNFILENVIARTTKIMVQNPRRVGEIQIDLDLAGNNFNEEQKQTLENAALNCPVAKSLHPDLKQTVRFFF